MLGFWQNQLRHRLALAKDGSNNKQVAKATINSARAHLQIMRKKKETKVEIAETYPPFDKEAAEYMFQKRPGTFSLIHFIGEAVSKEIAEILGRSINLQEAKHLVSLDGETTTCASEGVEFQPVRYLPFVPKGLKEKIVNGGTLVDIQLPWGGAYYLTKENEPIAYSGSVFRYNHRHQKYEWANASPLVIIADEIGKRYGRRQWGVPLEEISNILKVRKDAAERRDRIGKMVANIVPIRREIGRVSDVFTAAESFDRRNGKGYNRAKARREESATATLAATEE